MLEQVNLKQKLEKTEWKVQEEVLAEKLSILQQQIRTLKIPVVIVFEGWGASGKGSMISRLIENLDPRGFSVHSTLAPTQDERRYPWMRRFWQKLPLYGDMAIFDRSWYRQAAFARVQEGLSKEARTGRFDEILDFEQQITDDGYLLLKFFLHISQKEQKRRFAALESHKETRWRVDAQDWAHNADYDRRYKIFDEMLTKTESACAPWTVVEATDKYFAAYKVFTKVIEALEARIAARENGVEKPFEGIRVSPGIVPRPITRVGELDLSLSLSREEYQKERKACQKRLFELHNRIYQKKIPLILAYEGSDAAGKGGNIKRVTQALDPRGYEVVPVAAPSSIEKNHQHLWRFWNALPKDGHIAIFDRTWYGRVLVEHVEGFCTDEQWGRAYDEINRFERHLSDWGAVILKFWLQIDKEEQLRRFTDRQNTPAKQFKITDEDWRNREKWDAYTSAVDEMLVRTNTAWAPWVVVESNDKCFARIKTMKAIIAALEQALK